MTNCPKGDKRSRPQSLEGRLPKHIPRAPTWPFHTHKSLLLASGAQHEAGAATLPSGPCADPCGHPVSPCNQTNALEEVITQHPSPGLGQEHPQPVSHPAGPGPVTSPAAAQVPSTCQEDKANKPGRCPQCSGGTDLLLPTRTREEKGQIQGLFLHKPPSLCSICSAKRVLSSQWRPIKN